LLLIFSSSFPLFFFGFLLRPIITISHPSVPPSSPLHYLHIYPIVLLAVVRSTLPHSYIPSVQNLSIRFPLLLLSP
jgi:hypothetical protein